jgi:hypothetical protein
MEDYPELRDWLATQETFENFMKKSPYLCIIKDNEAMTAIQMLDFNNKIQPSSIVIVRDDGSYEEFWTEVYKNEKNIPYDIRLPMYSQYFLIY